MMAVLTIKRLVYRTSILGYLEACIPGSWDNQPLTLTYRRLSISLPIRPNLKLGYQACLTVTRLITDAHFLYLILEK